MSNAKMGGFSSNLRILIIRPAENEGKSANIASLGGVTAENPLILEDRNVMGKFEPELEDPGRAPPLARE
jgi:hypothetical protein